MSKKNKKHKNTAEESEKAQTSPSFGAEEVLQTPGEQIKKTEEGLLSPEQEMEQLKQRLQRLGADYQNYQKRANKQLEQATQIAREGLVKSLLPVLDNFEHTLENINSLEKSGNTPEFGALLKGVQIVHDHLMDALTAAGVHRIEVNQGEPFDPSLHEAMLQEENEHFPENTILRELARGYLMNGRTLRPAKVSVARGTAPKDTQVGQEDQ